MNNRHFHLARITQSQVLLKCLKNVCKTMKQFIFMKRFRYRKSRTYAKIELLSAPILEFIHQCDTN